MGRSYRMSADRAYQLGLVDEVVPAADLAKTVEEMATLLRTCTATVKQWGHHGLLRRHLYSDKNEHLYEPPGDVPPTKCQGTKLSDRRRFPAVFPNRSKGVQCEA